MRKYIILTSIFCCLLFSSCLNLDSIKFVGVERIDIKSASKLDVGLEVWNGSKREIKIKSAGLELYYGDTHVLSLLINREVIIPRESVDIIRIPIHMRLRAAVLATSIVSNMGRYKAMLTISGYVRVKVGVLSKKIRVKEMPISQFIDTFGVGFKL